MDTFVNGAGATGTSLLNHWGHILKLAFGATAYHVGSSTKSKTWRDVDVRMLLDDKQWEEIIGCSPSNAFQINVRWECLTLAISLWGEKVTGLPIDFQFQPIEWANKKYPIKDGCWRNPLMIHLVDV